MWPLHLRLDDVSHLTLDCSHDKRFDHVYGTYDCHVTSRLDLSKQVANVI